MEISISFSSIIQVVSLIFFAGGSYVLVQYKLKEFLTRHYNVCYDNISYLTIKVKRMAYKHDYDKALTRLVSILKLYS